MRVIVAGSRTIRSQRAVDDAIAKSGFKVTKVLSGGAKGVDALGEDWARRNRVEVVRFKAHWNIYGRAASVFRNIAMARAADALVAVWDGKSPGTNSMISEARKLGLRIYIHSHKDNACIRIGKDREIIKGTIKDE